ncbi:hypothetical protein K469DRAFT_738308 [Zopfia rhizophila CBS 207.26]|uniref:Hypervirulence associated protein TUDOR domain-containing protein n=1 Tax=Zopfia rhizophila CBS 207.26 TaxID=1314779 RepID=A0A6A6E9B6_9PEZI|nr:hypothetical protein K469DRAFT_738308 [Zopfia rhizophila CBS 207.26]
MPSKDKYIDPELRDEVKEDIHQSDKGGAPGQWSATKMMASEYKKRDGYTTDKKDKYESQRHLDSWMKEDWQMKEGTKWKEGPTQGPTHHWEEAVHLESDQIKYRDFKKGETKSPEAGSEDHEDATESDGSTSASRKQKSSSNKDEPQDTAGDKTRALPGFVDSEVAEVVYEEKPVEGKSVKRSKEDPRVVLKSSSSSMIVVHKP